MKLDKQNWKKVEFGQIINHIEIHERDPDKRLNAKYVSVEHLTTLDLRIKGVAAEEKPTFSRTFKKGQVLFAKRRAYQKKVAVATFDGICSGDLMVLETKGKLSQHLLAFMMQKDSFYEYVNANSSGSLSPRIKWNALSKYKFKLPTLADQEKILSIFHSLEDLINKTEEQEKVFRRLTKKLVDDFVSNFHFGNLLIDRNSFEFKWIDCVEKIDRNIDPVLEGIKYRIGGENIESSDYKIRSLGSVKNDYTGPAFVKKVIPNDILYVSRNPHLRKVAFSEIIGVCANTTFVIRSKEDILSQHLLKHIMLSESFSQYAMSKARGSTNPYINWKDLNDFTFILPDLETQKEMAEILDDCISKAEIAREQSITLIKLKHKLLDEIFD